MKKQRVKGLNLVPTKLKNVHTNGHLLLLCEPTIKPKRTQIRHELTQKNIDSLFKESPTPYKVINIKESKTPYFPNGVILFYAKNNRQAQIQKDYYLYILHHFPDAKFKLRKVSPHTSPIGIFNRNKKVGFVMPCRD